MSFGGGGKIKASGPDPNLVWATMMGKSNPVTQLPTELQPTAPSVLTPSQLYKGSASAEQKYLKPLGLNVDSSNPLFGPNPAQTYANQDYQLAIQPQLNNASIGQFLSGNLNNQGGSTFGGAFLGNMAAAGAQQAFENGSNYQNTLVNQLLARRGAFFGQDVATGQQQNLADIQRAMGLNDETTQRIGQLDNFNSSEFGTLGGVLNNSVDANLRAQQLNQQSAAAQAANVGNLIGGGVGTLFGLGNGAFGGGGGVPSPSFNFGSIGGGSGGSSPFTSPSLGGSFMGGPLTANNGFSF